MIPSMKARRLTNVRWSGPTFDSAVASPSGARNPTVITDGPVGAERGRASSRAICRAGLRPAILVSVVVALAGCVAASSRDGAGVGSARVAPPFDRVVGVRATEGQSVLGRPIESVTFGSGEEVVLILASIHGDEPAGTALLQALASHLEEHPRLCESRRIVLAPVANPDGFSWGRRGNARGVDLNRNFAAPNHRAYGAGGPAPLSEPESRAIESMLRRYRPDRIVSIHQPLDCVDYDGPAELLALEMASLCGMPVKRLGSLPGSLGSYAGEELGIPIVTWELPESANAWTPEELWRRYGPALLAAIEWPGGRTAP